MKLYILMPLAAFTIFSMVCAFFPRAIAFVFAFIVFVCFLGAMYEDLHE